MKIFVNTLMILLLLGLLIVASGAAFIVKQTEQAIVLRFGKLERTVIDPGLKFRVPVMETVTKFDRRLLEIDPPVEQITLFDKKRIDLDSFTRFRIVAPLAYYKAVMSSGGLMYQDQLAEEKARDLLSNIINSNLREKLGRVTLPDLLSEKRSAIMKEITADAQEEAKELGLEIAEVRIRRADLPEETSRPIFNRMRSEREREAREFRAEGQEAAEKIRSSAERERTILLAEAKQEAETIRGEGDKTATKIWADAAAKDADFYAFYRSLQAYRKALKQGTTSFVLSPDSEFFKYMNSLPKGSE